MFDVEIPIDWTLLIVGLVAGTAVLVAAAVLGARRVDGGRDRARASSWTPIVPWLGAALVVALVVRGSLFAAAIVAVAALAHAALTRRRA